MSEQVGFQGHRYWDTLSSAQSCVCIALSDRYEPLAQVMARLRDRISRPVARNVGWEKLVVLGLLEVDAGRRDNVYVRRGAKWNRWAQQHQALLAELHGVEGGLAKD